MFWLVGGIKILIRFRKRKCNAHKICIDGSDGVRWLANFKVSEWTHKQKCRLQRNPNQTKTTKYCNTQAANASAQWSQGIVCCCCRIHTIRTSGMLTSSSCSHRNSQTQHAIRSNSNEYRTKRELVGKEIIITVDASKGRDCAASYTHTRTHAERWTKHGRSILSVCIDTSRT